MLCNTVVVFFDKIQKAKEVIKTRLSSHGTLLLQLDTVFTGLLLDGLQPPTEGEVRWLISTMPNKSPPVDCILTSVIKSCIDVFASMIVHLAQLYVSEGKFPSRCKTASVTTLLKKKDLDSNVPSNFRPISNLHTISKIMVRLFMARIQPHIESCRNFNQYQSAYRRGHSTETTLLKMFMSIVLQTIALIIFCCSEICLQYSMPSIHQLFCAGWPHLRCMWGITQVSRLLS